MTGLCVLVAILGVIFDSWISIQWVLIYDLFSITDAPDVSGILSFCRGAATLIIPALQTLILAATGEEEDAAAQDNGGLLLTPSNDDSLIPSAFSSSSSSRSSSSLADSPNLNKRDDKKDSRSFGNQMVMVMLCIILIIACLLQYVMYFLVIRKSNDKKEGGLSEAKEPEQISSPSQKKKDLDFVNEAFEYGTFTSNREDTENQILKKYVS